MTAAEPANWLSAPIAVLAPATATTIPPAAAPRMRTTRNVVCTTAAPSAYSSLSSMSRVMFYFPTISPNKPQCAWISHEHVKDYKKVNSKNTQVIFRNNLSIVIPISIYSFETQLFRTALLRTKLAQKLNEHNRRNMVLYNNHSRASEQVTGYGEDNRR